MKKRFITLRSLIAVAIAIVAVACGSKPPKQSSGAVVTLDENPVIARKKPIGKDTLTVVDLSKADSTIILKLSDLAEDIRFIRLQNSNSALVADGMTWVAGNRIIVYTDGVVRQFDMEGNYLGRIGDRGHGPGQYTIAPSEVYVDEAAERIYLIQPGTTKIMMYDAKDGSFIRNIPLAYKLEKGRIHVDTENKIVTVAAAPFKYSGHYAGIWVQDFRGRLKSSVTKRHLAVNPDYSNEVMAGLAASPTAFDYSVFSTLTRPDTLYTYSDGKLHPSFTYTWDNKKLPVHEYRSTPDFFALVLLANPKYTNAKPKSKKGSKAKSTNVPDSAFSVPALTPLVVDRKSLRGNFAHLMLDNIGPVIIKTNWLQQSTPENFVMTFVPMDLADLIKAAPQTFEGMDQSVIKSMNQLRDSIHPKDNNYVIVGKWKQPEEKI
ncbi:MAG: 6-bladed beta-propeller [Muribaculaceae bacterium]|nr:6-bladed beta-propeller [Muribaculaceae bacterium]